MITKVGKISRAEILHFHIHYLIHGLANYAVFFILIKYCAVESGPLSRFYLGESLIGAGNPVM